MYCGSLRIRWVLGLVGVVGLVISNCAWAMDGETGAVGTSMSGSGSGAAIACPQYGDIAGQAIFYPDSAESNDADAHQTIPITINLEIARTIPQQRCGLMFRDRLPDDRGMGFPFDPPAPVSFWMKNVPVALDMVFLTPESDAADATYRITGIITAPPCTEDPCPTYGPESDQVAWVIELAEGRAIAMGLKTGDRVQIQQFDP